MPEQFYNLLMKSFIAIIFLLIGSNRSISQDSSITNLEEVVVKAYGNSTRQNIAAAVNIFSSSVFSRYGDVSTVNAINSMPGIVMEERSPGSYRLNIRGSALRSPFGVRNVKVYYNDIPFTDPGGTTYLNALGVHNFQSLEIIKGPGSSMYGAGTGGVMLIEGADTSSPYLASAAYTYGSYNLHQAYFAMNLSGHTVSFHHQQSDGYRSHSTLQRDVFSYAGILLNKNRHQLKLSLLYSDVNYQTPGGLTITEFLAHPKQSRPAAGVFPSAIDAKAAIYQENLLSGLSYRSTINKHLSQTSVLYLAYNTLSNPAIRNYGRNTEPHFGGRSQWSFTKNIKEVVYKIDGGLELQQNLHRVKVFNNVGGNTGAMLTDDRVHTNQYFVFLQGQLNWRSWVATAGASINQMQVKFNPVSPSAINQTISFSNGIAPRISLLRKLKRISLYAALEKGFSPPSAAELLPSGSPLNLSLRSERGWNQQVGIRGTLVRNVYADLNVFYFSLDNTIVQRRDAAGGEYFINGGSTQQYGIETYLGWHLFTKSTSVNKSMLWLSHALHSFHYRDFKQVNNDYSGNRMPGNAPHIISAGFDLSLRQGFSAYANWYYSDKVYLNDANTATATSYHLVGIKLGYTLPLKTSMICLSAGVNNLLNETYSNGNDINAAGGRYYNVAAGRNYYVQLKIDIRKK